MFAKSGLQVLRTLPRAHVQRSTSLLAQRRSLSDDARKLIDDAVKSNPLVVFMKGTPQSPQCGFSRAVCQILDVQGVPPEKLTSFNCLADQELREGIKEYSEWPTIPQVYVKGEFVGGCDIVLSTYLLMHKISVHQSGELEKLLIKEGLVSEFLPEDAPEPKKSS